MQTTMHVGVVVLVVISKCIEHGARFLRGCGAIKVDQAMAMRLLTKNREILTDNLPIDTAASDLMHILICAACQSTPVYSNQAWPPGKIDKLLEIIFLAWISRESLRLAVRSNHNQRNNL